MEEKSRTYNSMRNIIVSIGVQVGIILISFISRTIFIKILGAEYLGVNSLFTNVLTILSLAELGIGSAIVYSMYKPLAVRDEKKIAQLMNFYKKVYRKIGIIVLICGIVIIPFLKYIINTEKEFDNLYLYYALFLINTVSSYFFIYKSSIINADQKIYIQKIYHFMKTLIQFVLQTIALLLTHNFTLYLVLQIVCTIGNNIALSIKADKLYPYINNKVELSKDEKKSIYSNVGAMFIYKISSVIIDNTDNILISIMIGTVWVGYYSNYYMVISALLAVGTLIFSSLTASIGNLNAEDNIEKKEKVFNQLDTISLTIFGIVTVGLANLFNDFITVWLGDEYLLDQLSMYSISINFYVRGILNPIWVYRDTTGLFKDTKWMSIILAVLNLVLSIILGKIIGLAGILVATFISQFATTAWYQPYMLYKKIFKKSSRTYFIKRIKYMIITILAFFATYFVLKLIPQVSIGMFIVKGFITVLISTIAFSIIVLRDKEVKELFNTYVKNILMRIKPKNLN